tara:strand:+ start:38786 stop:39337 length:552 start_codon:yes stop_codon:yes gene_type:complete
MASTSMVDLFVVYQFIKRLATPFNKWEAYSTGVIDELGNILVPPKDRNIDQQKTFKIFDVMILKLKRLLEKLPFGKTRLASYAAALYLVKEDWQNKTEQQILTESSSELTDYIRLYRLENYGKMLEDVPTMSAGSGQIAGMGINGPDDVKMPGSAKSSYRKKNSKEADTINKQFQIWTRKGVK